MMHDNTQTFIVIQSANNDLLLVKWDVKSIHTVTHSAHWHIMQTSTILKNAPYPVIKSVCKSIKGQRHSNFTLKQFEIFAIVHFRVCPTPIQQGITDQIVR